MFSWTHLLQNMFRKYQMTFDDSHFDRIFPIPLATSDGHVMTLESNLLMRAFLNVLKRFLPCKQFIVIQYLQLENLLRFIL